MKKYIILLVAIFISMNTKADVFEIVSFKYKDDVPFDIQQNSIASLNDIASTFPGFKSRTFYYSKENGRWLDLITWASLAQAKAASEKAMQDPEAMKVFALMDEQSMIFSYYEKMGGVPEN